MDSDEFYNGLKKEKDKAAEWTSAADFFIGLKKRASMEKRSGSLKVSIGNPEGNITELDPEVAAKLQRARKYGLIGGAVGLASGAGNGSPISSALIGYGAGRVAHRLAHGSVYEKVAPTKNPDPLGLTRSTRALEESFEGKYKKANALTSLAKNDPTGTLKALQGRGAIPVVLGAAAIAGGLTYLGSKPKPELGGKSSDEDKLEGMVEHQKKRGESSSFSGEMADRTTEYAHGMSKAFRKHPGKASALAAVTGAAAGLQIAKMLGSK